MSGWPFGIELMQFLATHRSEPLLSLFSFFSSLGDAEGYILMVALIYTMYDKRLAFRLSVLVLITMSFNHLFKTIIKNPRPFIADGSYVEKWAVSADNARSLATEYSTPSGTAMSASAFYAYLYASVTNRYVKVLAVIAIIFTGLSRPYLGVHYLEDIFLGWMLGLAIFVLAVNYADRIGTIWAQFSHRLQIAFVVAGGLLFWLLTFVMNGAVVENQPLPFVSYLGFLTGIIVAYPLELRVIGFDPKSSMLIIRLFRFLFTIPFVSAPLLGIEYLFDTVVIEFSYAGHVVQYLGYALAGFFSMFLAPLLFVKLNMASINPPTAENQVR